jgi:hypothetical protein
MTGTGAKLPFYSLLGKALDQNGNIERDLAENCQSAFKLKVGKADVAQAQMNLSMPAGDECLHCDHSILKQAPIKEDSFF